MRQGQPIVSLLLLLVVFATPAARAAAVSDWLAVSPEDLKMTEEPKAPAAPAVYLYRQIDRDDNVPVETIYSRIKILTDEGLKYANLEIPFLKGSESVRDVEARTIAPDGSIVAFAGEIYEKPLLKSREVKFMAKSLTLPNVSVGSIIEYRYKHRLAFGYVFNSRWLLSDELFTRHAKFSLIRNRLYGLRWSWPLGLPTGTEPPSREGQMIRLETRDVPAFVTEQYMPPEDVVKFRVDFIYEAQTPVTDLEKYWRQLGKRSHQWIESFVRGSRVLDKLVADTVAPEDSPETKLRKLYARTQQFRNTTYERDRTEQEEERARLLDARSASDIINHGYGDSTELTWLYLALVRAAGMQADAVLVGTRDRYFFDKRLMNSRQLNGNLVLVKLGDQELYLDPGNPFTPYGLLPWYETAVSGLRLDKSGGTWLSTPKSAAADSRVHRRAVFELSEFGSLEGKVTVTYTGLEASWRRSAERHEDEQERKEFLEDELKGDVPVGIDVKLVNSPEWTRSDVPLIAEYKVEISGWAERAGKHTLFPVGLFGAGEKHTFEHSARVHPVYFRYPYRHVDDVTIDIPQGWRVTSLPKGRSIDAKVANYTMFSEGGTSQLRLKRDLSHSLLLVPPDAYPRLREFFQSVRAGDEEQIVLLPDR